MNHVYSVRYARVHFVGVKSYRSPLMSTECSGNNNNKNSFLILLLLPKARVRLFVVVAVLAVVVVLWAVRMKEILFPIISVDRCPGL